MLVNLFDSAGTFQRGTVEKVSFILLNQLDLVLTVLAISLGIPELNPIFRFLLGIPALLLVVKLVIPIVIAWAIPGKLLLPSIALLAIIIILNVKELLLLAF